MTRNKVLCMKEDKKVCQILKKNAPQREPREDAL